MSVTPRVLCPVGDARLGSANGLEFVLLGIEVWSRAVVVSVACAETQETKRLSDEYTAAVKGLKGPPKEPLSELANPASAALELVTVALSDDVGTRYESSGGSGPSWNGRAGIIWKQETTFVPSPPSAAETLTVSATVAGDRATPLVFRLPSLI
jgi:hypothetical protein